MLIRKLICACLSALIPFQLFPVNALEEQLLDYRQISQVKCRQAIQDVEKQLSTYNLKFITNKFNIAQFAYNQAPQGSAISFWMEGGATQSILNSNQLMFTLSKKIINNCSEDRIIAVDFAPRYTGLIVRFGIVDGVIKPFTVESWPDCDNRWGTVCVT